MVPRLIIFVLASLFVPDSLLAQTDCSALYEKWGGFNREEAEQAMDRIIQNQPDFFGWKESQFQKYIKARANYDLVPVFSVMLDWD